jgi:hypothetical protein
MSKALEAAVKAVGNVEVWDGDDCQHFLTPDEQRRIAREAITAFLDAAAGDERLCLSVGRDAQLAVGDMRDGRMHNTGKAAILALKEAVNG